MKNKKAISPLIATVLLIGFTVALAAVVMTWGGGFIRKTTESTETSAETTLACANLNLEITGYTNTCDSITVSNSKDVKIVEFMYKIYDKSGNALPVTNNKVTTTLEPYGVVILSIPFTGAYRIELIPKLESGTVCADAPIEKVVNCQAA